MFVDVVDEESPCIGMKKREEEEEEEKIGLDLRGGKSAISRVGSSFSPQKLLCGGREGGREGEKEAEGLKEKKKPEGEKQIDMGGEQTILG